MIIALYFYSLFWPSFKQLGSIKLLLMHICVFTLPVIRRNVGCMFLCQLSIRRKANSLLHCISLNCALSLCHTER